MINSLISVIILLNYGCGSDKTYNLPVLETLDIIDITENSAKSGGNIVSDGGRSINDRGICWNNRPNPSVEHFTTHDGTGTGCYESLLLNLESDETYFVKAYAINEIGISYGEEKTFKTSSISTFPSSQIIADHTVVDKFNDIPQTYIDEVKKMMVWFAGESHAYGYRAGLAELEAINSTYDVTQIWGFPEYSPTSLRVVAWPTEGIGEKDWYTWKAYEPGSMPASSNTFKNYIATQVNNNNPISVMGFAWCWDGTSENGPTATADPILGVHWWGASDGGPDGNRPWGLDAADQSVTGNRVCMDTYLSATEDYISYVTENHYPTKIVFTTGPVDSFTGENGYQQHLKYQKIREYVASDANRILFDYADILCYDDNGNRTTTTWNGHVYPIITPTNLGSADIGHIGAAGRLRLAKAQWWLLARIAGWDGK